jgi:HlyD family secretion protein
MVDIARPNAYKKRLLRRITYGVVAVLAVGLVTLGVSRLRPAGPAVDRGGILIGTVKRGPMVREVRGTGTLVAEEVRIIPAATDGRVEQRLMLPGTKVEPASLILILSNPQLEQATLDADYQLKGAQAEYQKLRADMDNQSMQQRSVAAGVRSEYHQARIQQETNEELFKLGLISDVLLKTSQVKAEELGKQNELAQEQADTFQNSIGAQLAVQQAKVDQQAALDVLKHQQLDQLKVRAGIAGVLQEVPVEAGQQVTPGTILARVAEPTHLKAQLKVDENQAKDVQLGQAATVDTHSGVIPAHVKRIDPAVQNGTVTVDVALDGALPPGARPDLSVESVITIEKLDNVLHVERPAHADANTTVDLFKVTGDGSEAVRVSVRLGRASVNTIEVLSGLQEGDQIVLTDMSASESYDRVRLK